MRAFSAGLVLSALAFATAQSPNATIADNLNTLSNSTSGKSYQLSLLYKLGTSVDSVKNVLTGSNNVTLFAPTDDAFKAFNASQPATFAAVANNSDLLTNVLDYHVLPSGIYAFNYSSNGKVYQPTAYYSTPLPIHAESADNVTVTSSDGSLAKVVDTVQSSNGVIYVIDHILVPPPALADALNATGLTTLVSTVTGNDDLNKTVSDTGLQNYTLFAPTNDAFSKFLTFAQQNNINASNPSIITSLVQYHIVTKQEDSASYFIENKNVTLPTALGNTTVQVTVQDGSVLVWGEGDQALKLSPAKVTKPDNIARGGIFHVVDAVIVPNNASLATSNAPAANGTQGGNGNSAGHKTLAGLVSLVSVAVAAALVL